MEATGTTTSWGFSRALDLHPESVAVDHIKQEQSPREQNQHETNISDIETLHFLILGASDPRHILQTIAKTYTHSSSILHFHICETQTSTLLRHLILMSIALQSSDISEAGFLLLILEVAETFLEVYGNIAIRPRTNAAILAICKSLKSNIFDSTPPKAIQGFPNLHLQNLKFRERDDIETSLNFIGSSSDFSIQKMWDTRLRRMHGSRFDSLSNLVDWDYHARIKETSEFMYYPEYQRFRMTGMSFAVRQAETGCENRSLATVDYVSTTGGRSKYVDKSVRWGWFGDMFVGPYIAFGSNCSNRTFDKVENGVRTCQEVCEYNLREIVAEIRTAKEYDCDSFFLKDQVGVSETRITEIVEDEDNMPEKYRFVNMENVNLHFHPCSVSSTVAQLMKLKLKFDSVFVSNSLAHIVKECAPLLKSGYSRVIVENAKYMAELTTPQKEMFGTMVDNLAKEGGLFLAGGVPLGDEFIVYKQV